MADLEKETIVNEQPEEITGGTNTTPSEKEELESVETLMAKLAVLENANRKLKAQNDKMSSAEAERKRKEREQMTADQQAELARIEAEEETKRHIQDLESFKNKTLAKERYLLQGMPVDLAEKAAQAELDGDMDSLSAIQKQHSDAVLKSARAEWLTNRPDVNAGTGEPQLTKEQFANMGPVERTELKRKNPKEYERLRNLL